MTQHLRMPLQVAATGRLATVVDGSVDDVEQSLALLAATEVGERLSVPQYGTRPVQFTPARAGGAGVGEALRAAAVSWEPRAAGYVFGVDVDGDAVTVTVTGELRDGVTLGGGGA